MKRRVLTIITVFLLLGAIVNVAVVWGCAYVAYRVADAHEDVLNRMQIASVMDRWLGHHDYATEAYGGTLNAWSTSNTDIVYSEGYTLGWVSGGWPLQSFEGGLVFDGGGSRTWGLIICGWLCLPYLPTWPGFPINTLFYAAILWGLFAAPFALRRRRRIKRGLCSKCAYPIGANPVCTECGAAVERKT